MGRKIAAVTPAALPSRALEADRTLVARSDRAELSKAEQARPIHSAWMISLLRPDDAEKAQQLLSRARAKGVPATAKAFTEKVQKGRRPLSSPLRRARGEKRRDRLPRPEALRLLLFRDQELIERSPILKKATSVERARPSFNDDDDA